MKSLFWNQPLSSKDSREEQRHTEADRHKCSQHDPISPQETRPKTRWKCVTGNITHLMVNMKFMVLPSLQWPVQICVTLNSVILQDIAPGHGKSNVYYSRYTHNANSFCCAILTAQLQNTWEARLEMTLRIQNKQCSFKRTGEYVTSQERSLGLSHHGHFSEGKKFKDNIPIKRTCWLFHFYMQIVLHRVLVYALGCLHK